MSRSNDKRIVELELNNKNFENNAKVSINTIDKLKAALNFKDEEDSFVSLEKASSVVTFKPITDSINAVKSEVSTLGKFTAGIMQNLANDIYGSVKKIWNNTLGQIQSGGSSRAMNIANAKFKLEGLGVAWDQASKDISAAVDGTAYGFDAAANTASQLATAGVELGDAFGGMAHSLRAVSGIAAMTNSSYEEIGYIFSQVASLGKLQAQDAMQISTRGINVMSVLGKTLGKTTEEIQEMMRKGEISFATFAEAMNDTFGDQATKANETFQGALSNVKAALSRIGEIWYGPFYNAAITPLNKIREAINKIKKAFDDGNDETEDFKTRLTELMNIVSRIFAYFTESADLRFFKDIAKGLNTVLDFMNDIGHGWEKVLGIFKTDDAVKENEKLENSIKNLTETELQAAKDIWEKGTYGNGQDRINNLLSAGFDEAGTKRVQAAIDQFIDSGYKWESIEEQVAKNGKELNKETEKFTANLVKSKILRTLESVRTIVHNVKMTFEDLGKIIWNVADTALHSFLETFEFDKIVKDVENLTYKFHVFINNLVGVSKNNKTIKKIFDEIFGIANNAYRVLKSVFSIVGSVVVAIYKVIKEIFGNIKTGDVSVKKLTDKIADGAENLAKIIKESDAFYKIFKKIIEYVKDSIDFLKKVWQAIEPLFDKAGDRIGKLSDKIRDLTGIDIVGGLKEATDIIKDFFNVLKDPFVIEENGLTAIQNWADRVKSTILEPFKKPAEVFESVKTWFVNAFNGFKESGISNLTGKVVGIVTSVLNDFFGFIYTLDVDSLMKKAKAIGAIGALVTSIVVGLNINKLIKTIQEPLESIKGLVGKITGFIDSVQGSISEVSGAIKKDLEADVFIKYAVGIGILVASIAVLSTIDILALTQGLLAVLALMAMLTTSIVIYNKTVGQGKTAFLNTQIVQLGISLGLIASVMLVLGNMSYEKLAKGMIAITFISAIFGALTIISNKFPSKGMWELAVTFAALGVAILAIVPLIKIVGEMKLLDAIQGVAALGVVLVLLIAAVTMMSTIANAINPTKATIFGAAIAILAASVNLLIPFIELVGRMPLADSQSAILALVEILVACGGVLAAIQAIPQGASKAVIGAAGLAIVFASLNLVLPSIVAIATVFGASEDAANKAIMCVLGIITATGLVVLALGMMTNPASTLAAAAGMAIVFASINALLPAILTLAAIPSEALTKAMAVIIALTAIFAATIVVLAIANDALAEGVVLVMVSLAAIFASIGIMVGAIIAAIGYAVAMIGTAVMKIALALEKFGNMDMEKVKANARELIKVIDILANGIVEEAPAIKEALTALLMIIQQVCEETLPGVLDSIQKLMLNLIATVVENFLNIFAYLGIAFLNAIKTFGEELLKQDDEGNSLFSDLIKLINEAILQALEVGKQYAEPIAEKLVEWLIAVCNAWSKAIDEHGEELTDAFVEALTKTIVWLGHALEKLGAEFDKIGADFVTYLWDGVKKEGEELGPKISKWVEDFLDKFREHFGFKKGNTVSDNLVQLGKNIINNIINGIKALFPDMWSAGEGFVNNFLSGAKSVVDNAEASMGFIGQALKDAFIGIGLNQHSESPDNLKAGKYEVTGVTHGMQDALAGAKEKAKTIGKTLKDTFLGNFSSDGEEGGTLLDSLMNLLGINTDEFSITPVLDTSEIDAGYSDLQTKYGDTSFSTSLDTSSGLAYDVGSSDYGSSGVYSSGASDGTIADLANDVRSISERMMALEVRLDTGALVGGLYAGIDEKLGEKQILAGRGVYA